MNTTPPNLKRQAGREPTGVEQLNVGLEASHIYVEAMPFDFTELFLSDEEIDQMCVIPSREPKGLIARWMPAQRPVSGGRRSTRPLQAVIAAGMAWLALPGCSCGNAQVEAPTAEVRIEAVRTVTAPRVAVQAEAAGGIARHEAAPAARREAVEAPHQARAAHVAVRPASMLAEFAMLDQAKTAIDAGHYKEALGIYKHLLPLLRRAALGASALRARSCGK